MEEEKLQNAENTQNCECDKQKESAKKCCCLSLETKTFLIALLTSIIVVTLYHIGTNLCCGARKNICTTNQRFMLVPLGEPMHGGPGQFGPRRQGWGRPGFQRPDGQFPRRGERFQNRDNAPQEQPPANPDEKKKQEGEQL